MSRHLKIIANAGEPDDVLALRIDVIAAAVRMVDVWDRTGSENEETWENAHDELADAVHKYNRAVKRRLKARR